MRHPSFPHVPAAVTRAVTSPSKLTQAIRETMSKKIGRIGDWNNNSQSGSDRFVSQFVCLKRSLTVTPGAAPVNQESQPSVTAPNQIHQPDTT